RGNVCSRGTHLDGRSRGVAGSGTSPAGKLAGKSAAGPLSGGEARTHGRDSTEFRHSESERRRRATRRKSGDPRDPRTSAGGFWKPDRRPDSIGGLAARSEE